MPQESHSGLNGQPQSATVYTIGHGSRSIEDFLDILQCVGVTCVADARAYPMSRRYPDYSRPRLSTCLEQAGISYLWLGTTLGGFRKALPSSPNVALAAAGFRGYADHMCGGVFLDGIEELLIHSRQRPTAILCAERLPQECHRSLIADYLLARDVAVIHLIDLHHQVPHRLNKLARWEEGQLVYDKGTTEQLGLEL